MPNSKSQVAVEETTSVQSVEHCAMIYEYDVGISRKRPASKLMDLPAMWIGSP